MRHTDTLSRLLFLSLVLAPFTLAAPLTARAQRVADIEFTPTARAQIAVWVEDADGTFLRTLALTQSVARRGIGNRPGAMMMNSGFRWPYGRREGVLPVWAHARAGAPGAELFQRVIFQNRTSEGWASRSANDFSRDDYFCLSFARETTGREALDAVTCASQFNSDKGRYATEADVAAGYSEPIETMPGVFAQFPLDVFSLYPPRRDSERCSAAGCNDHPDVARFASDALRVMPELDAISMATPPEGSPTRVSFTFPDDWADGEYVFSVEVNTEGDYNDAWGPTQYPTPQNPTGGSGTMAWDYWALSYGYPYRGQPSVVYRVRATMSAEGDVQLSSDPEGFGSLSGRGMMGGEMQPMDASISDDPDDAPGSGADRLHMRDEGWRVRVTLRECTADDEPPGAIEQLAITAYEADHRHRHEWGVLTFVAPGDDRGISRYEVRVSTHPITDEESFMRAVQAQAASMEIEALVVDADVPAGQLVTAELGGMSQLTHYWIGVRAVDGCNVAGPIAVVEHDTPAVEFTTVSPCFVATAAYGSPMAEEIGVLRRFRDRHLLTSAPGRALVSLYETVGPWLADAIREDDGARAFVREALLGPLVEQLR